MAFSYATMPKVALVGLVLGLPYWPYTSSWVIRCSLSGLLKVFLFVRSTLFHRSRPELDDGKSTDSAIYGLDHGRLNIALPPPTMWMNMGYWKTTSRIKNEYCANATWKVASEFPSACCALLDEVLKSAKLRGPAEGRSLHPLDASSPSPITVIDLGFGCGDQTVYLMQGIFKDTHAVGLFDNRQDLPRINRYVGVTLNRKQFRFTRGRLAALNLLSGRDGDSPYLQIFCEDAARPDSWSEELDRATRAGAAASFSSSHYMGDAFETKTLRDNSAEQSERWVLALDTLIHFRPSRQSILNHAYRELQASVMAYDLILANHASRCDRAILFVASLFTGTPFSNFLTENQYRRMLALAGYAEEDIEVRDVSEYVFAPLARFLDQREKELKSIGLSIGAFRWVKWLFWWWGRTGVVKGVIVVARR